MDGDLDIHIVDHLLVMESMCNFIGLNFRPFLFQSLPEFTPSELELSNEMILYYGNFIRTGDPNGGLTRPKVIWPK